MKTCGRHQEISIKQQIAPLIDVVFLLLIYFMVTSSLIKKESEFKFALPLDGPPIDLPVQAFIQIDADGGILVEGMQYSATDRELAGLVSRLSVLRQMADAQKSPFLVTLAPDDRTLHQRIVDVMDACTQAKVSNLMFADS